MHCSKLISRLFLVWTLLIFLAHCAITYIQTNVTSIFSRSSTYQLNAESLTDRIVTELRPFVLQALKAEVEKIRKVKTEQIQAQVTTQVIINFTNFFPIKITILLS